MAKREASQVIDDCPNIIKVMEARKDNILMCVSLAASRGFSELLQNSPRSLNSSQKQERCVPPMSSALNQREENRVQNSDLGSEGQRCHLQPCWERAGSSHLPQEAAGASNISFQFHEQSGAGKAPAWLQVERISCSAAVTLLACSGTTPGREEGTPALGCGPYATLPAQVIIQFNMPWLSAPETLGFQKSLGQVVRNSQHLASSTSPFPRARLE